MGEAADRVRARVARSCRAATDPMALYREVARTLDRAVGVDRWCGLLLDPATVMNTGGYHDEGLPFEYLPRLLELEATGADVNALPVLARDRAGISTVHRRTRGRPERSARFRDVLAPAGLGSELRVVLRDRRRPWGALVLFREAGSPDFSDADLRLVSALSGDVAAAVRRTLLVSEVAHRDADTGPGMAVLRVAGDSVVLEMASRAARVLLDQVPDTRLGPSGLPVVVTGLVTRLLAEGGRRQASRVRLRSGRWVSLQVDVLEPDGLDPDGLEPDDAGPHRLSLVVEPVGPFELAEVIAEAYGLTARERQVARLVVTGRSNPQVAALLGISATTVQDHLKSVFAKLGVGSRHELTARMFFDQYLPRQQRAQPIGGDGWYVG
jgi:DNA-binding CsgD family transcriptional regulator